MIFIGLGWLTVLYGVGGACSLLGSSIVGLCFGFGF